MKTQFFIIVLIALHLGLFAQTKSPFAIYTHKYFAFSYPASWDTTKQDKSMIFTAVENNTEAKDPFKENLSVYSVNLDKAMSPQKIVESVYAEFKQKGGIDKDVLEKAVKKNKKGLPYALFKSKTVANDRTVISTAIYFPNNKKVFILTLSHDMIESGSYDELYQSIIDTFEMK